MRVYEIKVGKYYRLIAPNMGHWDEEEVWYAQSSLGEKVFFMVNTDKRNNDVITLHKNPTRFIVIEVEKPGGVTI